MMKLSPRLSPLALLAIVLGAALLAPQSMAAPPEQFDARVREVLTAYGIPGMAVAIVEGGRAVHAQGYGVRQLGAPEPVDADTIFQTGSTGKAITSAALALLVDEGRIGWDDRVIDHLPDFQMYDPWVTREITIRDLLVHRSGLGLGAGDLMFVPRSSLSRAETVRRVRHLKPATSFRSGYAYDNLLYVVAGQLIEAVSGQTWEAFVRDRVLRPAGMASSTTEDAARLATPNRARPHARMDGGLRGVGNQDRLDETRGLGANAAPAGGVSSSANDLVRWLGVQLARGALPDGTRLYSEDAAREMWKPQVLTPTTRYPGELAELNPLFSAYALGWSVRDYRGARVIEHGGAVLGVQAIVVLLPDHDTGFAMMINSEDGYVLRGLAHELLDHYLGAPRRDWVAAFAGLKAKRDSAALETLSKKVERRRSTPSLPLRDYAGRYTDAWYGPITLAHDAGRLRIDFLQTPDMAGTLQHWQYDTFRVDWDDRTIEPAYVTFSLDAHGAIERITMKAVSPLADFSYDYHDLLFTPSPEQPER